MKILRNLFSFILPVTALIIIPWLIEKNFHFSGIFLSILGFIFILVGISLLVLTVRMFILIGKGTLAPWDPTRKLVTASLYGYVRNPMILGVLITLAGEAIVFTSVNILIWMILFWGINTIYFILLEEPGLEKRFGEEYREYRKNVPRWIPRTKPWTPGNKKNNSNCC